VRLARVLATLGPVGYAPFAPATAASAVVTLIGWFIPPPALPVALTLLVLGTGVAVWAADVAERSLGHDAKPIVVDEVVGQSLALLWVPHNLVAFALAFVLFRLFDVWKPLGARAIQRLPGGLGVVADDVVAGFTACAVYHLGAWALGRAGQLP
jgi:phosphatidylglycerophosphatase A